MEYNYYQAYTQKNYENKNSKTLLPVANPNKFKILKHLINLHAKRGDKILVFIDAIEILNEYSRLLNCPYISGEVSEYEREKIIQFFKYLDSWNVLLISRVGDVGIDLPDANVAIEISSLFGSRR